MIILFLFLSFAYSDKYDICSPAFAISSPSFYSYKINSVFNTPYLCFQMNLRATSIPVNSNAYIAGFTNFGLMYSNENNTPVVSLVYFNNEQKVESLFTPKYFEWYDVCLSSSESNLISVYVNGEFKNTFQATKILSSDDSVYLLCSKTSKYNIGTVSGLIYGSSILTAESVTKYHSEHTIFDSFIFKQKARLLYDQDLISFNELSFIGGEKTMGGLSALRTSVGIPLIDDGCYDGAINKLPMRRNDLIPSVTITPSTINSLTNVETTQLKTDSNYFIFDLNGTITINSIDTNNKRFVRLELDLQGNFIVQYLLDNKWNDGIEIKSQYYSPNYSLYLPYYLLGSNTSIRFITTSTPSSEIDLSLDPFIKEIRIHYGSCVGFDQMFCAKDGLIGKCSTGECATKHELATKTFDFNDYSIPSPLTQLILKSKENENNVYVSYKLDGASIGVGTETILGSSNSKFLKFSGVEVNLLELSSYDIPSGWGKYSNEYTYLFTIKIENSTSKLFKASFYDFTLQTMTINLVNGIPTISSPMITTESKPIPLNKWIKIGIRVNSTTITIVCDGQIVLKAINSQFSDYLSSTALKLQSIIMNGNSLASIQHYPIAVTDNILNQLTLNDLTIENTCSTSLPNICIDKKSYSPIEKGCSFNCLSCEDGKCKECLNHFELSSDCTLCKDNYDGEQCNQCASGYRGYPDCKKNSTTIIIVVVVCVSFIIILLIVTIIVLILVFRKRKSKAKENQETELKAIENNGTSQLLKNAKKKKVIIGNETLIELGNNIYINKTHLDFNLDGEEPDVDTPLLDTLLIKNHTDKQFAIWIQTPKKDKFFLQSDIEKEILQPQAELNVHFEIQLHCNCSCKEKITIRIEDTKTKQGETGTISLAISTYKSIKIDFDEIELKQPPLGDGAFGIVYQGTYRGIDVAVKKLKERTDDFGAKQEFEQEVTLLNRLRGPHIVGFIGACYLPQKMCIAIEFAPDGSLGHVLKKVKLSYEQKLKFMLDCSKGMMVMHAINVIHRDLKPDNLLMFCVDQVNPKIVNCKITDFGTSRAVQEYEGNYTAGVGTPVYMAPELLKKEAYTVTADQFSFAIMMFEVFIQDKPYASEQFKMPWDIAKFVIAGKRLERKPEMTDVWWNIISGCWDQDPQKRPSFKDIAIQLQDELGELIPSFAQPKELSPQQKQPEQSFDPNMKTSDTLTMTSDASFGTNQSGLSKFINTTTDDFDVN